MTASPHLPLPFVLCADDYGLAPGVGAAIRDLIERGRLSATSCMTAGPYWPEEARRLAPLADRADIGLHLTLTDQRPAGPMPQLAPDGRLPSIGRLIGLAWRGRLDPAEIAAEVDRQLDSFGAALGRPPDFIDGHQHAHLLPTVRDAVLAALAARCPGAYLRLCGDGPAAILRRGVAAPKAGLLTVLGHGLARRAAARGVATNRSFRGVYDLTDRVPFGDLMARFLDRPQAGMLVMVHPGHVDAALCAVDGVTDQREREYAWLAGDGFADLLARRGLAPRRFMECC